MSLEYCDSFDTYTDPSIRWESLGAGLPATTTGRHGTNGMFFDLGDSLRRRFVVTAANAQTAVQGAACHATAGHSSNPSIFVLYDEGNVQMSLRVNALTDNSISVLRGDTTTLGTSAAGVMPADGVFRFLEWKVKIHNSTGTVQVWLNGVSIINLTGQDTQATANAYATHHHLGRITGNQNCWIDDYYCLNSDTGGQVNPIGDSRPVPVIVTAAGNSTQFTPSAGSNWQNVDDAAPDEDSTYNSSSTVGQKDLFTMSNIPTNNGPIYGIQVTTRARKDDAGTRTMRNLVRVNSTDFESGDLNLLSEYQSHISVWEQNPDTTAAWTVSEVNSVEAGYKIEA